MRLEKLNRVINDAMKAPELQQALTRLGAKIRTGSPEDFATFISAESKKWRSVVEAAQLTAN